MSKYIFKFNPITKSFDIVLAESLIHLKNPVDTYNDLPTSGNSENDARFVKDTDDLYVWTSPNPDGDRSNWKKIPLLSNLKLDNIADGSNYGKVRIEDLIDGHVFQLSDGSLVVTAPEVKDAVNKAHTAGEETVGGDLSGTVGNATVETVGGKTKDEIADTVNKKHTQNTDQYLDYGGANQVSASQVKGVVDLAPNLMEKVAEVEVSSDCTYIDFDNLDGNSAWFYMLFATIKNPLTSDVALYLFVNNDTNNSNYYTQNSVADGTTASASRSNTASILWIPAGEGAFAVVEITKDMLGYFRFISRGNDHLSSSVRWVGRAGIYVNTITNITSLRVQVSASNAIGAGSKFILFKVRRS